MIIKILKIISCSSEDPLYPSSNLLEHPPKSSWRCAKSNELIATIIFQLAEPYCITGLEIGNYRSCFVVIEASTFEEPDKWVPIVNHQFLSHDEAINSKFKDQVQLFTKQELNPETIKIKFVRVKVTCMQSANLREVFGLKFIVLKTEVIVDLGLDIFGRFKLKERNEDTTDEFSEKYLKLFGKKRIYKDELKRKIIQSGRNKKQEEIFIIMKKPNLNKIEADIKINEIKPDQFKTLDDITLFPSIDRLQDERDFSIKNKIFSHNPQSSFSSNKKITENHYCSLCNLKSDELCKACNLLSKFKPLMEKVNKISFKIVKPPREFNKLFEDISFSLSGYINPQRDEIRRKALKMGAKYIVNPNLTNNKCTHLICCFKNTPKSQQLKDHCKIVGHKFIEDCFDNKKRMPWRRYALDSKEYNQPESEEEIEGNMSPIQTPTVYQQDTDDSDSNY